MENRKRSSPVQGNASGELLNYIAKAFTVKDSKRQCVVKDSIHQGNALSVLKTLPSDSVDMAITSPPYWGLRDYGVQGQLGQEADFADFVKHLADIFDEVRRVLKPEGTCWVNLGDSYAGSGKGFGGVDHGKLGAHANEFLAKPIKTSIPSKSLCLIPDRFAIEMVDRGWILRNEIIWHKPNAMPQSVKDRFNVDFEKMFFFTKSKKYFFQQQIEENGRNRRTVWSINTKPFPDAHFAVYPETLLETPILAGCPVGGTILDPFFGSGTTGVAANRLDRHYVGIELNAEYVQIAEKRLAKARIERAALISQLPLEA